MHPSLLPDADLIGQCQQKTLRRGGPGGQHRNKVETAVVFHHLPSGIVAEANERRSQVDNRRVALFRLRLQLAVKFRSPWDIATRGVAPPWPQRGGRIQISAENEAFPGLLSELLDFLHDHDFELSQAAGQFEVTPSQLVKFLRRYPPAFEYLNAARKQRGLLPLH